MIASSRTWRWCREGWCAVRADLAAAPGAVRAVIASSRTWRWCRECWCAVRAGLALAPGGVGAVIASSRTWRWWWAQWCAVRGNLGGQWNRGRAGSVPSRMDDRLPFRGSVAVADGLVTRAVLCGPRFRRLYPDVYVRADVEVDLVVRSLAAAALTDGRGVLSGYSAAELLGASCGPLDAPAEVIVPGRRRAPPGLLVREEDVPLAERWQVGGTVVTSPVRTALDIACRGSLVEAVAGVDALAHRFGFPPQDVVHCAHRHPGRRGAARLPTVVRLANPLADSPMGDPDPAGHRTCGAA